MMLAFVPRNRGQNTLILLNNQCFIHFHCWLKFAAEVKQNCFGFPTVGKKTKTNHQLAADRPEISAQPDRQPPAARSRPSADARTPVRTCDQIGLAHLRGRVWDSRAPDFKHQFEFFFSTPHRGGMQGIFFVDFGPVFASRAPAPARS